jgi:tetratricopeptide (TPR) repeat protein
MNFINPFELLDITEADAAVIKKAKKRKLAEFDLSDDGIIEFGNQKVTKSDFIRVTDELDNKDKAEFYLFVKNNPNLNNFLTIGDTSFFTKFRQESIYNDADFISFVSSYFAEQYNKVLLEVFQSDNLLLLKKIVANPPLVNSKDTDKAYRGLSQYLKNIEVELHDIRTEIDNEESYYDEDSVDELDADLREKANNDAINILPNYFQSQRNEIAQKIRNISVAVFNGLNNVEVALQLVSYALEFNTNNLTRQKLQKDYEQIKEIYESRQESERFSPELERYAGALILIVQLIKKVENDQIQPSLTLKTANSLFSVTELNMLPDVFDEIREQLAMAIRGLSVAVWNKKSDIQVSLSLIFIAQQIKLKAEIKSQIDKAYTELSQLRDKQSEPIVEVLQGIKRAIIDVIGSRNQTVNLDKVQEVLNDVFQSKVIQELKYVSAGLKSKIFDELKAILLILPAYFVNDFIGKLSIICNGDSSLVTKLDSMKKVTASVNKPQTQVSTSTRTVTTTSSSSSNSGWGAIFTIVGIIVFLAIIFNLNSNDSTGYDTTAAEAPATETPMEATEAPATETPMEATETPAAELPEETPISSTPYNYPGSNNTNDNYSSEPQPAELKVNKYKGNQLSDGASPFNACFGKGKFGGEAWLLFRNSNSSDAIVCLVNVYSGKTVRNEYIQAGSNYKMREIPSGTYYLKVFYGNDWNPTLHNVCGTKGSFETDAHFSKSDNRSDWIEVENSDYSYTTGEITLYTVSNGNMSQAPINEESFFDN